MKTSNIHKDDIRKKKIEFRVLDPVIAGCACQGLFHNAIKHTERYCCTENQAISISSPNRYKENKPSKKTEWEKEFNRKWISWRNRYKEDEEFRYYTKFRVQEFIGKLLHD